MSAIESVFTSTYKKLALWLDDINQHEITNIVELVAQAKKYAGAAESLSEHKLQQFIDSFRYDLHEFYQQNQAQLQHSIYLTLLNEVLWGKLAQLTDKSQVEWSELLTDLQHQGKYYSGDMIGFGELQCLQCQNKLMIVHLSEVTSCIHCQGREFIRLPLKP